MGRPRTTDRQPKRRFHLELTIEEYARLGRIAHQEGRSMAATCRLALRLLAEERQKEEG